MGRNTRLDEVGESAEALVRAYGVLRPPIDLEALLAEEPVRLCPGDYRDAFDGRLEYLPAAEIFLAFYNIRGGSKKAGRARFSLAHEAGHYFLDSHRNYLLGGGEPHNSQAGFQSSEAREREADIFAAHLLMPSFLLAGYARDPDLETAMKVSATFETSLLASAIRLVESTSRSCALVVARGSRVDYAIQSEDMKSRGWLRLPRQLTLPPTSPSRRAKDQVATNGERLLEGKTSAHVWREFSGERDHVLWEQATYQKAYDRTITFLSYDPVLDRSAERDDGDDDEDF
jgi:hypothetical protein